MDQIVMIASLCVVMLIIGYFIGQSDVIKLKKENLKINQLYRKTTLEMHNSEGRNRRLRNYIANYLPEKRKLIKDQKVNPIKMEFRAN